MSAGLSNVLVEQGIITPDDLERATAYQQEHGLPLSKALVSMGLVTERQIVAAVASQIGLPFCDMDPGSVDPEAAALLPRQEAESLIALPVAFRGHQLVVAVADPQNSDALSRVAQLTGMETTAALAPRAELLRAIGHLADETDATWVPSSAPALGAENGAPSQIVLDGDDSFDQAALAGQVSGEGPTVPDAPAAPSVGVEESAEATDEPSGGRLEFEEESTLELDKVLLDLVERGGSDLHLTAGLPPMIRLHGDLMPLEGYPMMTPRELRKALYGILNQKQRETFENQLELDLSYSVPGHARFRVNVFQQRDAVGSVMRVIPFEILSIADLGVPAQVTNFAYMHRGFVLVTGPTGSGKSTTLASLINVINEERRCHIMTIEDPIEFLHKHKTSVINQREVGTDTHGFAQALKHVLRQDPDVILVGEMRDLETIQVALTAAETGHLVFGTLHTQDAPQTIDRVIDVFPPHQQEQIRVMLSGALQGVLCQQLLRTTDGNGRVVACELMVATPAIRNLIREGKTHQMYSSIQAGKQHGMLAMDQSLATLVQTGKVRYEVALEHCVSVPDFNRLCGRA